MAPPALFKGNVFPYFEYRETNLKNNQLKGAMSLIPTKYGAYPNNIHTVQKTQCTSITKNNRLIRFSETIDLYHMNIITFRTQYT
jgi:hypothetical protein